jgi:hypothetical protein
MAHTQQTASQPAGVTEKQNDGSDKTQHLQAHQDKNAAATFPRS